MRNTFITSPVVGGIAAVLGWLGAILLRDSMSEATFISLRFGWAGLIIGATAVATLILVLLTGTSVEPLVTSAFAGVGVALLWDRRELPFSTRNFEEGTTASYWFIVTMMLVVFVLLVLGLRGAKETNNRARG